MQELIFNLHGIGTPHSNVSAEEGFFWVTKEALVALLDNIVAAQTNIDLPVALTFDDGNVSDTAIALPELARRGLKATFFVCSGRIGSPNFLDRNALAELLVMGMEVGTHGMDHQDWRRLDEAELDREVGEARRRIEDVCGVAVKKAAIPFGSYNRGVLRRLRRERLERVYTSDGGLARSGAWLKPRNTMDSSWLEADIKRILTHKPSLAAQVRQNTATLYKSLR